jgi:co-chaperonin GroES (HSP10)
MTTLRTFKDNILFTWVDAQEQEVTLASGIVLQRKLDKNRDRWGVIIAVGPLSTATVGEYILPDSHVEAYGAKHPDSNQDVRDSVSDVWRVRDENVLCVSNDISVTTPFNSDRQHTKVKDWETL